MQARIPFKTLLLLCASLVLTLPADAFGWEVRVRLRLPSIPGLLVVPDVQPAEPEGPDIRFAWDDAQLTGTLSSTRTEPPTSVLLAVQVLNMRYDLRSSVLAFDASGRASAMMSVPVEARDLPSVRDVTFKPGNKTNGFIVTVDNPSGDTRLTGFGFNVPDNGGGCYHPEFGIYDLRLTIKGDKILGGTATRPGEPYSTKLNGRFVDSCNHTLTTESQQFSEILEKGSREIAFRIDKLEVGRGSDRIPHPRLIQSFGSGTSELCVHFRLEDGRAEVWGVYAPDVPAALLDRVRVLCAPLWLPRRDFGR